MHRFFCIFALVTPLLAISSHSNAQSFYVDVTNSTPNAQVHLPDDGDYAHYPSYDNSGPGFSAGSGPFSPTNQGTFYIADGFLTGHTLAGLWESSWLDAIYPAPDMGYHGGYGTVDILTPGGISGAIGTTEVIYGNGLPAAPLGSLDTNGQYLGIGGEPNMNSSEYALWGTPIVISTPTTFRYEYYWSPAGATLPDGTEILPLNAVNMGAQFFILNGTTDYTVPGAIEFAETSTLRPYEGMGNQQWFVESGVFTLDAGTYYWGFSNTGDSSASYIAVEGITVTPVPEPSGVILILSGAALFAVRRRRVMTA